MNSNNYLVKQINNKNFQDKRQRGMINEYMKNILTTRNELETLSPSEIKSRVHNYDTEIWKNKMANKPTLHIYRQFKVRIQDDNIYENDHASCLLFRCRSNTLKLNWRNRLTGEDTCCRLCTGGVEETLQHFLLDCEALSHLRHQYQLHTMEKILGFNTDDAYSKKYIKEIWKKRKNLLDSGV